MKSASRSRSATIVFLLGMFSGAPASEAGQIDYETVRLDRKLPAVRATGPIDIDGSLDEPDWNRAPIASGFIQSDPREGEPATEETEVRILYDANALYVGVYAHDRQPERILVSELAKDFNKFVGDDFEIVLDTFRDERNGYMFATNARGAKWDAQMINEGREINEHWDALWDVKARIVETGWYAEIAIPFRTLRFSSADQQIWGINFMRRIRRLNEDSFWAPLPRIYDLQRVSLAGTLEGLQGVRPGSDLRLKPYVLGSAREAVVPEVGTKLQGGFDVKYGVTSGVTLDFTINTNFSQIEADEQQINLTRFSLFYPEKRDFFLENSGIFQFGQDARLPSRGGFAALGPAMPGIGGFNPFPVFPFRQNTAQDTILFFSRRIGITDTGEAIPILGGTRLTGRVGPYSLGMLNIQQKRTATSPATNFTAIRVRRNVLTNSDIGAIVLNKDSTGPAYNRVVGTDGNFRFSQTINVSAAAAKTFSPAAAVSAQGSDAMGRAGVSYRDDLWDVRFTYIRIGERFNDEMGYLPRTGIRKLQGGGGPHFRWKRFSSWLRETYPHFEVTEVSQLDGTLQSRYVDAHVFVNLQDASAGEFGINPTVENLVVPFNIHPRRGIVIPPGRYEFNEWFANWRTNGAARLVGTGRWAVGQFYDGYKHTYQLGGAVRLRGQFNAGLHWSRNQISLKQGHYTTDLIAARLQYGISTTAIVYALLQYNTDAQEWSSNVRFNVIHHPLSDFFLVYNERRASNGNSVIDRSVVAKLTHMLAF